jgi:hypothetical protein
MTNKPKFETCANEATADAVVKVNNVNLTAVYRAQTGAPETVAIASTISR